MVLTARIHSQGGIHVPSGHPHALSAQALATLWAERAMIGLR